MKVAFIRELFGMGGIESVLHNTAVALKEYDFEFYAICIGAKAYKGNYLWDTYKNVKVIITDNADSSNSEFREELSSIINNEKIDLVCYDYLINSIVDIIKKETKAKTLYWYHNSPIATMLGFISVGDSKKIKYPILKYLPFNILVNYLAKKRQKEIFLGQRYLIEESDFVAVLNEFDRIAFIKYLKLDSKFANKIKVLINSIEIIESPNIKKEKLIVYMGRFEYEQKRVERFVDIWNLIYKDLPDWRLELYGDGECFDEIKEKINNAKLERIYLMGRTDNPNEIYDKAAIVALTSQHEGWGMVLAEGQNNGCIPIAFASVGGIKTIIKGGGNLEAGVLVTPFKIKEYAEKLKNLCLNEEYRKELQKNALIKRNEYTMDRNIPIWLEIKKACEK